MDFKNRIKHAWNAFMNKDPTPAVELGPSSYYYPERTQNRSQADRSMITSIFNRIAMDVASIEIMHSKVDADGNFLDHIDSPLNECLQISANIDQTGRALIQDAVQRMLETGSVALVPIVSDDNPNETGTFDIYDVRCGNIVQWYPRKVEVEVYNDKATKGTIEKLLLDKEIVCIIQNPMYSIMNAPSSVLNRIFKKLALLDVIDNENASNKLNMIIQVPYSTRSQLHQDNAARRRKEIEDQLINNPYGIAYMDINEKLIQLSKPLESNLLEHIKYLMETYKNQLGITDAILNNTASESEMNNYIKRTIEPICAAICDEMKRKWLTKTARTKGQSIIYYEDPFRLIPVTEIAKLADVLSRNEIMTSNEMRQKIGMKPSDDPRADELNNANMPDYYPPEDQNGYVTDDGSQEPLSEEEAQAEGVEPQTEEEMIIPDDQSFVNFDDGEEETEEPEEETVEEEVEIPEGEGFSLFGENEEEETEESEAPEEESTEESSDETKFSLFQNNSGSESENTFKLFKDEDEEEEDEKKTFSLFK